MNFPFKKAGIGLVLVGLMIQLAIQPPTISTINVLLSGGWMNWVLVAMPFAQYLIALVMLLITKRGAVAIGGVVGMLAGDLTFHGEMFNFNGGSPIPWSAAAGPLWNVIVMMPLGRIAGGFLESALDAIFGPAEPHRQA
ncbi:MAG: hypothetical protein ACKVQT_37925 [Burkholderiales bacterium]